MGTKLNIQLFAGPTHLMLTEGEQARYVNTMLKALGGSDALPLSRYMQIDSSPKTENAIFYTFGKLVARERKPITNDNQLGKDIAPVPGTNVLSVSVSPKWLETPLYVDDREFDKSQLTEESAISDAQVTAVYTGAEQELCLLFKDMYVNKQRVVKNSKNVTRTITIPAGNFFGDKTKAFDDPKNIKAFRLLMRTITALSKRGKREIAVTLGIEGGTELNHCEKFTTKDFNNFSNGPTPNQTGENPDKLLGGNIEQLIEYDDVMYGDNSIDAGATGIITIFISKSLGQKAKKTNINPTIAHIVDKKQYFMDAEVAIGTELVQGEGIFFFSYKRDTTIGSASVCSVGEGRSVETPPKKTKEDLLLEALEVSNKINLKMLEKIETLKPEVTPVEEEAPTEDKAPDKKKVK